MKINTNIFRKYDIRGIYPNELNEQIAEKVAHAFVELYQNTKKLVIARDSRISSPALAQSIISVLKNSGKQIFDLGIAPDPLFYFAIFHNKLDGGIMVSGSHNSKEYNGIMLNIRKSKNQMPEDVIEGELEKIKNLCLKQKTFKPSARKGKVINLDISNDYIDYVTKKISLQKPLSIVVDSSNGACGYLPKRIFEKIGCKVKALYPEFDGNFPNHLPDPYEEENLKNIKKAVLSEKADIGFCFDTDGDRVGPIDNKGRRISGDLCLLMLAKQAIKEHNKGVIIHDIRVSNAFLDEMKKQGVETYFSVSHHNAIIKKIIEKKAIFGGEITYHFLFPMDYYLCDEAIFSALKIAEIASAHKDFAKYVDSLPKYYTSPEIYINIPDEKNTKPLKIYSII